jgi:hypothetical protein
VIKKCNLSKINEGYVLTVTEASVINFIECEEGMVARPNYAEGNADDPLFNFNNLKNDEKIYGHFTVVTVNELGGLSKNGRQLPECKAEVQSELGYKIEVATWCPEHCRTLKTYSRVFIGEAIVNRDDRYANMNLRLNREAIVLGVAKKTDLVNEVNLDDVELDALFTK